jgi:flagellar biosynthesis protein FlhB
MAEDFDDSQKTEQPTQKKLREAEEKGDIAQSPEIATLAVLAAATALRFGAAERRASCVP